jgi:hypothetical protein
MNKKKKVMLLMEPIDLPHDFSKVVLEHELKLSKNDLNNDGLSKLLSYYSLAVSHYDTMNDEDSTMFYEHKIKQALKNSAAGAYGKSPIGKNHK